MKVDCPYEIVDVFSGEPFAGNPLAVVRMDSPLSPDLMQKIAREMNLSETTFYAPRKHGDAAWRARIFTPSKELAFAGHPILGAAWVIRQNEENGAAAISLALDVGLIDVSFEKGADQDEIAWFRAPQMAFGATRNRGQVAMALGLTPQDMDQDFPPREVTGGVTLILAPVKNVEAVRRARLDLTRFAPLAAAGAPPMVYVFCRTGGNVMAQRLRARFFFEFLRRSRGPGLRQRRRISRRLSPELPVFRPRACHGPDRTRRRHGTTVARPVARGQERRRI